MVQVVSEDRPPPVVVHVEIAFRLVYGISDGRYQFAGAVPSPAKGGDEVAGISVEEADIRFVVQVADDEQRVVEGRLVGVAEEILVVQYLYLHLVLFGELRGLIRNLLPAGGKFGEQEGR